MCRVVCISLAGVLCLAFIGAAHGADPLGPPWRNQPSTLYQSVGFDSNANPLVLTSPFGQTSASIVVGPYGSGWFRQLPGLGNQTGYWDLGSTGGQITINVDSQTQRCGCKEIWVQVTSFEDITQKPTVQVTVPDHPECTVTYLGDQVALAEHVATGGDWFVRRSKWRIFPHVGHEQVLIATDRMGSIIDQAIIDTAVSPPGDINGDGCVNVSDLQILVAAWASWSAGRNWNPLADCTGDGWVNIGDLQVMVVHWGRCL